MTSTQLVRNTQRLIDLLLRYVVPGGTSVLAFGALEQVPFAAFRLQGSNEVSPWVLMLSVAVAGPAIYSVHRAFLHRLLQYVAFPFARRINSGSFGKYQSLSALLEEVEHRRYKWSINSAPWLAMYEEWSAQAHFLYCSCWGLLTAVTLHYGLSSPVLGQHRSLLALTIGGFVLSAIISDFRALAHQLTRPAEKQSEV